MDNFKYYICLTKIEKNTEIGYKRFTNQQIKMIV